MINNDLEKIVAAIDYIEAHLNEKMELDMISQAVHYSKYYLHRTFSKMVGMTIHEYVQRRKLTESAKLLVFSDKSILDIALIAGYESQQAFTNIFTAMYKQPPNKYRENEKFYPLQLKYEFGGKFSMPGDKEIQNLEIAFAEAADIPCWMELVRLVVDGFPHLYEDDYIQTLKGYISKGQALIMKDGVTAVGILLFSLESGSIDFMGTHPIYKQMGIPKAFLKKVMGELIKNREISITTYREGDRADPGYRKEIIGLGFSEAELLVEFGYPTQRFVLKEERGEDE